VPPGLRLLAVAGVVECERFFVEPLYRYAEERGRQVPTRSSRPRADPEVSERAATLHRESVAIDIHSGLSNDWFVGATVENADGKVLFEPGMMFTYEMPVRFAGCNAAFNVEDDAVVTATGVENMSAMLSREMRVRL
jgi:hypothetical protein